MIEIAFLIPVAGNDGVTFAGAHHTAFEAGLLRRFGGFTRLPGVTHGGWRNEAGVVFTDACLVYVVGVAGVLVAATDLRATAAFARGHYAQEAIGIRYLGVFEVL